eukprot:6211466-Pleurochrysis_carterae.AAC.1
MAEKKALAAKQKAKVASAGTYPEGAAAHGGAATGGAANAAGAKVAAATATGAVAAAGGGRATPKGGALAASRVKVAGKKRAEAGEVADATSAGSRRPAKKGRVASLPRRPNFDQSPCASDDGGDTEIESEADLGGESSDEAPGRLCAHGALPETVPECKYGDQCKRCAHASTSMTATDTNANTTGHV